MLELTTTNKKLLLLVKEDNEEAFLNLYERYKNRLYAFVSKYLKQEADTEEIVQEVFLKIWESRSKIDIHFSFESFLFTIAYNAVISLLRKRICEKKYIEYIMLNQESSSASAITDDILYNELNNKLQALLQNLTPRQKEIFMLSREQGMTHNEISQKLGVSLNTVKKHMVNSLAYLRSQMNAEYHTELKGENNREELQHQIRPVIAVSVMEFNSGN